MEKNVLCLFFLCLFVSTGTAGPGTAGLDFLKIGVGAQPLSLGNAYASVDGGITSLFWNPAGTAKLLYPKGFFSYSHYLETIRFTSVAVAYPVDMLGVFSGSIYYLNMDDITGYDANDVQISDRISASDFMLTGGYGYDFKEMYDLDLSAGVGLKYLQENLYNSTFKILAVDAGLIYRVSGFNIGFVIQNFGSRSKFVEQDINLPLNYKFGISTKVSNLVILSDYNFYNDNTGYGNVGLEYSFYDIIAVRFGYITNSKFGENLRLGTGFSSKDFDLDVAYIPSSNLGVTYNSSLVWKFFAEEPSRGASSYVLEKRIESANGLYGKGLELMDRGRYLDAIEKFCDALQLYPEHKGALEKLEESYKQINK